MSMEIGPLPTGPATQDLAHERRAAAMQAEAREAVEAAFPKHDPEKKAQDIKNTTQNLEHISLAFDRRLKFEIDHESKQVLVKVIDNETDKVIKVLPPEELQRLHNRIRETMGFLLDEMA